MRRRRRARRAAAGRRRRRRGRRGRGRVAFARRAAVVPLDASAVGVAARGGHQARRGALVADPPPRPSLDRVDGFKALIAGHVIFLNYFCIQ